MASEVKWVKLYTSILNDDELLAIQMLPEGATIWMLWIKLLVLAGTLNTGGVLMLSGGLPYTDELLAEKFHIKVQTVRLGLKALQQYRMLEEVNGCLAIANWKKYQAEDRLEKIREKDKDRKRRSREEQKRIQAQAASAPALPEPKPEVSKQSDPYSFELDVDEAHAQQEKINREKSYLCDLAEGIGLPKTQFTWGQIDKLYERYGYEKTEAAITEAARQGVVKFAYIEGILRNEGKPKKKKDEEEEVETVRNPHRGEDWDGFDSGKGKLQIVGLE